MDKLTSKEEEEEEENVFHEGDVELEENHEMEIIKETDRENIFIIKTDGFLRLKDDNLNFELFSSQNFHYF